MSKKNMESNEKWWIFYGLLGGSLIIILEGVIFMILYYLGFLEWALPFGTMSLLFGGMLLIGVLIYSNKYRRSYVYD